MLRRYAAGKGRGRGGGRGRSGQSGGGRNVRGVDFGLGIGYSVDSANTKPSAPQEKTPRAQVRTEEVQTRGVAIDSLKQGMMARFKSSFVAASPGNPAGYSAPQGIPPQSRVSGAPNTGRGRGNFVSAGITYLCFFFYTFLSVCSLFSSSINNSVCTVVLIEFQVGRSSGDLEYLPGFNDFKN